MSSVALVAPFPNPHFVDIFFTDEFRKKHEVILYCFRNMPSFRKGMDWDTADFERLETSFMGFGENKEKILKHDAVVYYGAVDPLFHPSVLMNRSLKAGQKTYLATEGFKKPSGALKLSLIHI